MKLPRALFLTLSLALSLVPAQAEASESGVEARRAHDELLAVLADASWLNSLQDPSLPLAQRLELTVSEPELADWLLRVLRAVSTQPIPLPAPARIFDEIQATPDDGPILPELKRGFAAYQQALLLLPPDEQPDLDVVPGELTALERSDLDEILAMLTDPTIPEIVGDELQRCAESFVALIGATLLEDRDPKLALELAQAFSERAQGMPRLVVLQTMMSGHGSLLSPSVSQFIADDDEQTLVRDMEKARLHTANLRTMLRGC